MRSLLLAVLIAYGLEAIFGASVVIKNNQVYLDDKPVDLSKLEVIDDLPYATRYHLQSGTTNITITKSKIGNAISVASVSEMTPEELAQMKEFQKKLTHKIHKDVETIQKQVDDSIKAINKQIQDSFKNAFIGFPTFPWF